MDEWVSQNEYMRRMKIGFSAMKHLIASGQVETMCTGNQVRIKVGGDTVSRAMYEEERARRIEAETTIQMMKNLLLVK